MRVLLAVLGDGVTLGFVFLAASATRDLWRRRDRGATYLAVALGLLAVVAVASQMELADPGQASAFGSVAVVSLMASGFALLLFRSTFIPLSRRMTIVAGVVVGVATLLGLLPQPSSSAGAMTPLELAAGFAPIVGWLVCAGEPMVRFWIAARRRPAVQRSRLRALSLAYAGIVLILVLSLPGGNAGTGSESGQVMVALMYSVALATVPLLYVAFWPPQWLRSYWRQAEETSFREALQQLLLAETGEEAASAVVEWAMRLVGAGAATLVADGEPLASAGLSPEEEGRLIAGLDLAVQPEAGVPTVHTDGLQLTLILPTTDRRTVLLLLPGPFTPIFGADEVERLQQFGVAATAALERLRLISELTRASSAKSEFLSRMSHELRTPLNSILGFAQLLAMDIDDPKHSRRLGHISQAGKHLLALINDILDLSRIEAGQLSMSPEPVSIAESVQQAVDLIGPLADARGITVEVDEPSCDGFVLADANRLGQVLINLLSNAVKYNREAGQVRVFCEAASPDRIRIHVTDTGVGIELAQHHLVFRPFERLNAGRTAVEGTGIGLSLSKAVAELMNGTLGFDSRPSEGSDFWIELATVEAPRLAPPSLLNQIGIHLSTETKVGALVLYIEDNPANVEVISAIVAQLDGVRLEVAATGEAGLKMARHERPDVVFLDQHLPDISGLEVLRRLRGDVATRRTPIVMISADDTPAQAQRMLLAGAQAYLTKPLDVSLVVSAIDEAIRVPAQVPIELPAAGRLV